MDLHTSVSSDSLCACVWDGGRDGGGRREEGGGRKERWCVSVCAVCLQQYNNVFDRTLELNRIVQKG